MSLIEQITETITRTLTSDLAEFLADRFGLDSNDVSDSIKTYLGCNSTPATPIKKRSQSNEKSPPVKKSSSGENTCGFKITRGAKEGLMCGTIIRGNGDFCSKHKNRKVKQ